MMVAMANVVNKQQNEQQLRDGVVSGQRCRVPRQKSPEPTVTGKRIKEAREAIRDERGKPLSLRALAEQSGVGAGVISRIESGATQHAEGETLKRLAPHLRVSVDWLLATGTEALDATPLTPPAGRCRFVPRSGPARARGTGGGPGREEALLGLAVAVDEQPAEVVRALGFVRTNRNAGRVRGRNKMCCFVVLFIDNVGHGLHCVVYEQRMPRLRPPR